ncbi:LTA synthase family protein [Paenibacillus sp. GXUN7292]|uniref:LTA synthase family protein n=1 Tax=Paenibacillus sp. GXUN7292 TaxID=3422499 RepID=UPI00337445CE
MEFLLNQYRKAPLLVTFIFIMLKMALFRQFIFQEVHISRLVSDAAAVLVILFIIELVTSARWKTTVFGIINTIVSFLLFAAVVYFSYFSNVPTYHAFLNIGQVGQVKDSVQSSIQLKNYLLFADIVILLLLKVFCLRSRDRLASSSAIARPLYVAIALIVCLGVSFGYVQSNRGINNELVQAERLGLLNYQFATAMNESSYGAPTGEEVNDAVAALEQEQANKEQAGGPNYFGAAKGKNVIVLQLEAFQNIAIGLKVDGQEVTPVLNELIKDSFYFPHFFQQIGQGNTSDAEFLSNTGIYPTGSVAMSKGFGDREIPSMPRLLDKYNYVSNTFHVNDVTFWDRDKMYPALGFTKYYEKADFVDDKFNGFGASDQELYRVGMEKLSALHKKNQPFYAQFVTTASHHPFKIPKMLQTLDVPEGLQGTQLGNYLQALRYTDEQIGNLIADLKKEGMWEDTVLVIYGDHFGMQTKDNDPAWVEEQLGVKYEERISRFNIPFIVHVPGVEGKTLDQVGGQADIMPTVANLLGVSLKDEGYTVFGKDLLNVTDHVVGMRYYMPTGSFFNNEIMFVPGKSFEDGTAIDLKTFEKVEDFSKYRKDYDYVLELMKLSDDYMKSLPKR